MRKKKEKENFLDNSLHGAILPSKNQVDSNESALLKKKKKNCAHAEMDVL